MSFDYGKKLPNGQWEHYPINKNGDFVAPLRFTYIHDLCGTSTKVSQGIAETYAKNPKYYGSTFCVLCQSHFPVSEFKWDVDDVVLGEI